MGKTYKQNDRHFTKSGKNFNKPNKSNKSRVNFNKIKGNKTDVYDDLRGLS